MDERTSNQGGGSSIACSVLSAIGLCDPSPVPTKASQPAPPVLGPVVPPWIPGNIKSPEQVVSEIQDAHLRTAEIEAAIAAHGDTPGILSQASSEVSKLWDSARGALAGLWDGAGEAVNSAGAAVKEGAKEVLGAATEPVREVKQTTMWIALGLAAVAVLLAVGRR